MHLRIIFLFNLLFFYGCSTTGYLKDQFVGMMTIMNKQKENHLILRDVRIPKEHKEKIQKIELYTKFFYQFFGLENKSRVYQKTVLLRPGPIIYMVVSSYFDKVEAHKEKFPFFGEFPYLGFFDLMKAHEYKEEMEKNGFFVSIRPVYAFSSLGHYDDPILSSFFEMDEFDLMETIFHELFHRIFFIKNNVELNESLATYFAKKLMSEYFLQMEKTQIKRYNDHLQKEAQNLEVKKFLTRYANKYKESISHLMIKSHKESKTILDTFLQTDFLPNLQKLCDETLKDHSCIYAKLTWNNAVFALFLTYNNLFGRIEELHKQTKLSLKDFYFYLVSQPKLVFLNN